MATNLLNGSIYDYYGIVDKLKNMDPKNDSYAERMWNFYTSIYSGGYNNDRIFGTETPFIQSASNYGLSSPLDAVALGVWQHDLGTASGNQYLNYRSGGRANYDQSLASTLYTVSDTHLDALNYEDKWLRTQAGAVVKASNVLKNYVTRDNKDGTYNLTINPGADLGIAGAGNRVLTSYETVYRSGATPDTIARQDLQGFSGPTKTLSYENIPLFTDISAAYDYVRNQSSFLYNIKKNALQRTGKYEGDQRFGPTAELAAKSQNNIQQELNYAENNNLKNRRSQADKYKRNKSISQRLSATAAGAPGIGGSSSEDSLKLAIPNLLGL